MVSLVVVNFFFIQLDIFFGTGYNQRVTLQVIPVKTGILD